MSKNTSAPQSLRSPLGRARGLGVITVGCVALVGATLNRHGYVAAGFILSDQLYSDCRC
jgi:hypothetical protein